MNPSPASTLEIRDFPGIMSNLSPNDLPPGAAVVQVNAQSRTAGELVVRSGYRALITDPL